MVERKKKSDEPPGSPAYMLTWGDMCTLLLCFFVMLLAMSTIDPSKFEIAASSFQNAFSGVLTDFPSIPIHENVMVPRMGGDEQNKHLALEAARRIREAVRKEKLDEAIKVQVTDKGIAVKIADPIGFDVGRAAIKPQFERILYEMIKVINRVAESEIRVEGHTDDTPIHTSEFPSNWELSAARALNVVKFLYSTGGIHPSRLSAVGYGEYRPVASNATPAGKKRNRRIEIYVEYLKKQDTE